MTNARLIRALVVDDEPLAREMIREMLEDDSDVEIVGECANGREAVEAIKSLTPDSVFLDVQMPELGRLRKCSNRLHRNRLPTSSSSLPTINMPSAPLRCTHSITCSSLSTMKDLTLRGSV